MKCFYGAGNPIQLARSGININGFDLQIGTEGQVGSSSDFYLQEFIMAENVYTDDEIEATREWLKYR